MVSVNVWMEDETKDWAIDHPKLLARKINPMHRVKWNRAERRRKQKIRQRTELD